MRAKHAGDDGAVVREIWPDASSALARVLDTQGASSAPPLHLHRCFIAQQAAQRNGLGQLDQRVPPVEEHLEELADRGW